ncbi:MAG: 2-amino-4-hydroxy-6-hydroxymethyldihydropteridine diphosphokinase [Tannerellaceae bacterium]|jgi:2-amino-4-hydroxy-6-hydroxymethyldihydropteridine diphosphokinase|nr:2-amino-4-hydroxy-6-hydroxymethyldihydropteridine diphosphokinase [Tannerellaceae bacterium]
MATAYLSIGTNLEDKRRNMTTAAGLLAERVGEILVLSTLYETKPWGFESENTFLNAAVILETRLSPLELLDITKQIELEMGRKEKSDGMYKDRIIDIDILMYEDVIIQTDELTIPHPLMHKRNFVLAPLAEIAATLTHPTLKKTIGELYFSLPTV